MKTDRPLVEYFRKRAKRWRKTSGVSCSHSHALHVVATAAGFKSWSKLLGADDEKLDEIRKEIVKP